MPDLTSHLNVYSSAIALLDINGWELKIHPVPYEYSDQLVASYEASRDGTVLDASNPLELLALAAIHEYHHPHPAEPYWWKIEGEEPGLLERLEDAALEKSFLDYLDRDQQAALEVVVDSIQKSRDDPKISPEQRIGISNSAFQSLLKRFPHLVNIA